MKNGKHVIFLGAGASHGSGYPLANGLRLLISSAKKWEKALADYEDRHGLAGRPITNQGMAYWRQHEEALKLFRDGGFATIDEFCKLAGGFNFLQEINGLRRIVRAALGLFNPEENFEKSEYYNFVQTLFKDDLTTLRDDIVVLSYNYDPYLEFLLLRALEIRQKVILRITAPAVVNDENTRKVAQMAWQYHSVTSGFYPQTGQLWLNDDKDKPAFCLLKLHGSI